MQGGIFNESGIFITLKMLDSAFNLRSAALSKVFENIISQYGLFLQRSIISSSGSGIISTIKPTPTASGVGYAIGDLANITTGYRDAIVKVMAVGSTYIGDVTQVQLVYGGSGGYSVSPGNATQKITGSGNDSLKVEVLTIGVYSTEGLCAISDSQHVSVKAFDAIVQDSDSMIKAIHVVSDQTVDFTGYGDGTWKLLAQIKTGYNEEGTIALTNGSKDVIGTNTKFTMRLGKKMNLVILNSGEGNNGVYEVETVTSDTAIVLKDAFTGTTEATMIYSIGGVFPDPDIFPATTAGYRCYILEDYEFVITQSAVGSNQIYLCDVTMAGGSITSIADQRIAFKFKPHTHLQNDITDFAVKAGNILGTGEGKAVDDITIVVNALGQLQVVSPGGVIDASGIVTGLLALVRGGTHTDLSTTGGTGKVLKQKIVGGDIAVEVLSTSDIPALSATKITSDAFDPSRIPNLPASTINSGQLELAQGGTHKDMSATGGAGQFLKQKTVGGDVSVEVLATADIPDGAVTTAKLEYKEYIALLSQTGTNAPTATEIKNTLGAITFAYSDQGEYDILSTALFTEYKTVFFIQDTNDYAASGNKLKWGSASVLNLKSVGNNVLANGVLSGTPIMIRVYP
jgi:hypothetical protein